MAGTLLVLDSRDLGRNLSISGVLEPRCTLGITKVSCSFDTNRGHCWRQRSFNSVPSDVCVYNNIYYSPTDDDEKTQNTITFKGSFNKDIKAYKRYNNC